MTELMLHLGYRSRTTIYRLIDAGMPAHRPPPPHRLRFDLLEVDEWMRSCCFSHAPGEVA